MINSEHVSSLIRRFEDTRRSEPFDADLALDLLDSLKRESPEAFRSVVRRAGLPEVLELVFPLERDRTRLQNAQH